MLLTIEFDDCEQLPSLMSVAVLVLYNHVSRGAALNRMDGRRNAINDCL